MKLKLTFSTQILSQRGLCGCSLFTHTVAKCNGHSESTYFDGVRDGRGIVSAFVATQVG